MKIVLVILSLLCVSGCSYKKYHVKKLASLTDETAAFTETRNAITVRAKKMSAHESKEFFYDTDLTKKNIVPLYLTIENNSDADAECRIVVADGKRLSKAYIAQQLHMGCKRIVATTTVGGIAGWFLLAGSSASLLIAGTAQGTATAAITAAGILGTAGAYCILGLPVYLTYYRKTINERIDEQLALNSLYKSNHILAHSACTGIVYCAQNVPIRACITQEDMHVTFTIALA